MAVKNGNIKLFGNDSVLGRGVSLHDGEKDTDALLACGNIGLSKDFKNIGPQWMVLWWGKWKEGVTVFVFFENMNIYLVLYDNLSEWIINLWS